MMHILHIVLHKLSQDRACDGVKNQDLCLYRGPSPSGEAGGGGGAGFLRSGPSMTSGHLQVYVSFLSNQTVVGRKGRECVYNVLQICVP